MKIEKKVALIRGIYMMVFVTVAFLTVYNFGLHMPAYRDVSTLSTSDQEKIHDYQLQIRKINDEIRELYETEHLVKNEDFEPEIRKLIAKRSLIEKQKWKILNTAEYKSWQHRLHAAFEN